MTRNVQLPVGITGVELTREGNHTVVYLQLPGGKRTEIIRELFDNNFDHHVTASGIREAIKRDWNENK